MFHVLGAGVGQGDGVAEAGGIEAVTGEQFLVEAGEIDDVGMAVEQVGDFVERGGALGAVHVECDAGRSEERSDFAGHAKKGRTE